MVGVLVSTYASKLVPELKTLTFNADDCMSVELTTPGKDPSVLADSNCDNLTLSLIPSANELT